MLREPICVLDDLAALREIHVEPGRARRDAAGSPIQALLFAVANSLLGLEEHVPGVAVDRRVETRAHSRGFTSLQTSNMLNEGASSPAPSMSNFEERKQAVLGEVKDPARLEPGERRDCGDAFEQIVREQVGLGAVGGLLTRDFRACLHFSVSS